MVYKKSMRQRGDTLIEVLMSIAVLAIVIVGTLTIMNRGLASGQIAVEHTQVRTGVNTQIELLTYLRDQYVVNANSDAAQVWRTVLNSSNTQAFDYTDSCAPSNSKTSSAFYLARQSGKVERTTFTTSSKPATHAIAGSGLWVEARNAPQAINPPYVDFLIRACWQGSSGFGQQQTVTAIRLYTPYDPVP